MKQPASLLPGLVGSGYRSAVVVALPTASITHPVPTQADTIPTEVLDPNLQVTTVLDSGITQPIGIVFLGTADDFLVLEKASG